MAKSSTTFKKGKSGNPGGRSPRIGPNGETAAQLARMHTLAAINTLKEVMEDKRAAAVARVSAAVAMIARGWGNPTEHVELDADVKGGGVPVIQIVRVSADGDGTH